MVEIVSRNFGSGHPKMAKWWQIFYQAKNQLSHIFTRSLTIATTFFTIFTEEKQLTRFQGCRQAQTLYCCSIWLLDVE